MENVIIYLLLVFTVLIFAIVASKAEQGKKNDKAEPDKDPLKGFLEAKVVYVIDGDTVIVSRLGEEWRIRLSCIDCPEDGQDWGNIAKAGLIKLIGNRNVYLEVHGIDVHKRALATIYKHDGQKLMNINERMVTLGHAWVARQFYWQHLDSKRQLQLDKLETWARSKKVGLWRAENPIPPWLWREEDSKKRTG